MQNIFKKIDKRTDMAHKIFDKYGSLRDSGAMIAASLLVTPEDRRFLVTLTREAIQRGLFNE